MSSEADPTRRLECVRSVSEAEQLAQTLVEPTVREGRALGDPLTALGRYPIVGALGVGGMGEVFGVRDERIGRTLAAKVLRGRGDPRLLARFLREAQITGQLEHPNIVPLHELGRTEDGQLYFTMKCVDGLDLRKRIQLAEATGDGGAQPALLRILLKVCDAIEFAHSRGVIHRDLKPANVMVGRHGQVLLMDWGLAKIVGGGVDATLVASDELPDDLLEQPVSAETQDGAVLGTLSYMSPEQARGRGEAVDLRSDVYALGAILHRILAGRERFVDCTAFEALARITSDGSYTPPSAAAPPWPVPWELEALCGRAMAFDPDARYPSVAAFREDLEAWLDGRALGAARYTLAQRARKWVARHRLLSAVVALWLVFLVAGWQVARWREEAGRQKAALATQAAGTRALVRLRAEAIAALEALEAAERLTLEAPNGEPIAEHVQRWATAHVDAVAALERASEQARQLDTPAARQAAKRYEARRRAVCLAAARGASALGRESLATTWVAKARLEPDARRAVLDGLDRARRKRIDDRLAAVRGVLAEPSRTGAGWVEAAVDRIVRGAGPDVVRLLLEREGERYRYLQHESEFVRAIAIGALGRIGDGRTTGSDDRDAVEAMTALLAGIDPDRDLRTAVALVRALGRLADGRAYAVVLAARRRVPERHAFRQRTAASFGQIPRPAAKPISGGGSRKLQAIFRRGIEAYERGELQAALREFDALLERAPRFVEGLNNRAAVHLALGNAAAANADLDRAVALAPDDVRTRCNRGAARERQGRYAQALADYDHALKHAPDDIQTRLNRANTLGKLGRWREAAVEVDRVLRRAPEHADALARRGDHRRREGRWKEAQADYDRALATAPSHIMALLGRALTNNQLGRVGAARIDADKAVGLAPRRPDVWLTRARVHLSSRRPSDALADCERALALSPSMATALETRSDALLALGRAEEALKTALRLRETTASALGHLQIGKAKQALGDAAGARKALDQALARSPGQTVARIVRARLRASQGDEAGALKDLQAAMTRDPRDPRAYGARADLHRARGRLDEAITDYGRALERAPSRVDIRALRALTYWQRGLVAEARKDLDRCLELQPGYAEGWRNRAALRESTGDLAGALEDLGKAIELDPDDARARANRGNVYVKLGKRGRARRDLDRAVALDPELVEARTRRAQLLLTMGKADAAAQDIAVALRRAPDHGKANFLAGRLALARGAIAEAVGHLEKAAKAIPERAVVHLLLAVALQRKGDRGRALVVVDRALTRDAGLLEGYLLRGLLHRDAGRHPKALADHRRAVALSPKSAQARLQLGMSLAAANQVEAGLAELAQAVAIQPSWWEAHFRLAGAQLKAGQREQGLASLKTAVGLAPKANKAELERMIGELTGGKRRGQ